MLQAELPFYLPDVGKKIYISLTNMVFKNLSLGSIQFVSGTDNNNNQSHFKLEFQALQVNFWNYCALHKY